MRLILAGPPDGRRHGQRCLPGDRRGLPANGEDGRADRVERAHGCTTAHTRPPSGRYAFGGSATVPSSRSPVPGFRARPHPLERGARTPEHGCQGGRPVALRPRLSPGVPLSGGKPGRSRYRLPGVVLETAGSHRLYAPTAPLTVMHTRPGYHPSLPAAGSYPDGYGDAMATGPASCRMCALWLSCPSTYN